MPQEFEGDLVGAEFWGADLTGASFRDVNLSGVRITQAWLADVVIDALVERLVVNGVDVTGYVNERDPWHPLRGMLRPTDPDGMRAALAAVAEAWDATSARARALPAERLHESVGGEWSFVQTLRHLVFGIDKWFTAPILGGSFDPLGLPNTGSAEFPWPGLDRTADPSVDEAAAAHAGRVALVREYLATLDASDLDRSIEVLENGTVPLQEGLYTVFEEGFWHNRYALRDLEQLEARAPSHAAGDVAPG